MPNTIAHIGIQTLVCKGVSRDADFKWIAIGCIIPDIPWIMQRAIHTLFPSVNSVDLRLYAIIQASFFFALLLSASISLWTRNPGKIFLILAGNSLLHLLLDAMQTKWANGVHLLAPFSWQLTSFNLFWPEQLPTRLLTLLGLATFIVFSIKDGLKEVAFTRNRSRLAFSALLGILYILLPFLFFQGPMLADNHFLNTLLQKDNRTGMYLEIDRGRYNATEQTIEVITGEQLHITGLSPNQQQDSTLSLRGIFTDNQTVTPQASHVHHRSIRDISSMVGLLSIFILWSIALLKKRCKVVPKSCTPV